jgi:hypothetical protein
MSEIRRHVWISNAAFTAMTGIKRVCMTCGQPSNNADRSCPGKRRTER